VICAWFVCACITLGPAFALAQRAVDAESPQGRWEVLDRCRLMTNAVVDGDSFKVTHQGREYIFRLYFVDAPETDPSIRDRIQDQSAYFSVAITNIPRAGRLAADFTRAKLAGRDFTVVTRWQNAMGRSALARFYAIVLVQGENLAEELVRHGLARIYGLRANWPDGPRSTTFINRLKSLELAAREQQRGVWDEKAFPRLTVVDVTAPPPSIKKTTAGTVELNDATFEQLQTLPGIGPVLAQRIIAGRPYEKPDDLLRVSGIGQVKLEQLRPFITVQARDAKPK